MATEKDQQPIPGDPRYTLTDFEKAEVLALKERCDAEGVEYRSLFELAKFTMVAVSIKDEKKRRADSFNRLKKKKAFDKKHGLSEMDFFESLAEVEENLPVWALACGQVGGKWVIGYSAESTNLPYMKKHFRTIYKVELERYDLGAADLEEARNGIYIVGTAKDLNENPIKCIPVGMKLRMITHPMQANRVKGLYCEVPRAVAAVTHILMPVVPAKIRKRMNLGKDLKEFEFYKSHEAECEANLPKKLGGTYDLTLEEWFTERFAQRALSDELIKIE